MRISAFTIAATLLVAPMNLEPKDQMELTRQCSFSGWARYKPKSQTYVRWRFRACLDRDSLKWRQWRAAAAWRARRAHTRWINRHRHPYGHVNWDRIAKCESGERWHYNGGSGFDGGLQFLPSTWSSVMQKMRPWWRTRYAWQTSRVRQIAAAEHLIGPLRAKPWRQWPYCWRFA